jgi:hypothetical protein
LDVGAADVVNANCLGFACARGTELRALRSVKRKTERDMRKAIDQLDAEERAALLYLADLGTAICSSALVVSLLKLVIDVL